MTGGVKMKKAIAFILAMLFAFSCASAADMGVQAIGDADVASLDDLQLRTVHEISGYAWVIPEACGIADYIGQFNENADYAAVGNSSNDRNLVYYQNPANGSNGYLRDAAWLESGESAEFVCLLMDVTNLQSAPAAYLEEGSIKVVYNNEYEFGGWVRQANYTYNEAVYRYGASTPGCPVAVLLPENEEPIDMMYTGTYVFGCTVPNFVVQDKTAPLRMEIKLGENDLTYHIRK